MKKLCLISTVIFAIGALFLCGQVAAAPKGELIFAVANLGAENFALNQQFSVNLKRQPFENVLRSNHMSGSDEKPALYGWLAEKWSHNDDYTVFDFHMRKGIQFHKGWGELTAADVKYTFDLVANPELKSAGHWQFLTEKSGMIKSWEVVSKYHFRVNLSKTDVYFERRMTGYFAVYSKKYCEKVGLEKAFKEPIGTGPWQWVETRHGDYIKYEAVENHWQHIPDFKYLILKLVPDPSTQIFMLQSGQVNMAIISPEKEPEAKAAGLNIMELKDKYLAEVFFGGQIMHTHEKYDPTTPWAMHTDEPEDSEWNKKALLVRKAFCLAINHQAMIDKVLHGRGGPHVLHDHTFTHAWHKKEWQPYPFDPEKARALLAEAGYAKGFSKPVQVLIEATPNLTVNTRVVAELIAADLETNLGIEIERVVMESKQINNVWLFGHDSAWKIRVGRAWATITPGAGWEWSRDSRSPLDEVRESPKWDDLTDRLKASIPMDLRQSVADEGFQYSYDSYEMKGLFAAPVLFATGPEIKGYKLQPYYLESEGSYGYFFEFIERAK